MLPLLAILGLAITAYAIYVEKNAKKGRKFMCDVNDSMSCSVILTSKYARMTKLLFSLKEDHPLNLPNTYYGMLFYFAVLCYSYVPIPYKEYMLLVASFFSLLACVVLATKMYELNDICLVCLCTYVVNMGIMYYAWHELK